MKNSLKMVIQAFFDELQSKNSHNLRKIYSGNIVYNNPLCDILNEEDVFYWWQFFLQKNEIQEIEILEIKEYDEEYAMAKYKLVYIDHAVNKKINLPISSFFKIQDDLIIEQSDAYRLSTLLGQTHGITGLFFGWTKFMQRRVKRKTLQQFLTFLNN